MMNAYSSHQIVAMSRSAAMGKGLEYDFVLSPLLETEDSKVLTRSLLALQYILEEEMR